MRKTLKSVLLAGLGLGFGIAANAATTVTYHFPEVIPQGTSYPDYIFVSATNGSGFCASQTGDSRDRIIAGEMMCGEDESSYAEYDWASKTFFLKSTGSKNQCYPIFKKITCRHF